MDHLDDDPRERRGNKAAAERALRAHLGQDLGWLVGLPVAREGEALRWRTWPGAEGPPVDLLVDRERVRAATFGLHAALRRFPRALPRLVGDVAAWQATVDARLAVLKRALHDGAPLPELTPIEWLSPAVEGAAQLDLTAANVLARSWRAALRNVGTHVGAGEARDLTVALVFAAQDPALRRALGGECVLRRLLEDPRTFTVATEHGEAHTALAGRLAAAAGDPAALEALLAAPTPRPAPRVGHDLARALCQRPGRRLWLALDTLLVDAPLEAWDTWWRSLERFEREARSELGRLATRGATRRDLAQRARQLSDACPPESGPEGPPAAWSFAGAEKAVRGLLASCPEDARDAVLDALRAVPCVDPNARGTAEATTGATDGPASSRGATRGRSRAVARRSQVAEVWGEALRSGLSVKRARALAALQGRAQAFGSDEAEAASLALAFARLVVDAYAPPTFAVLAWEHREVALEALLCVHAEGEAGRALLQRGARWHVARRFAGVVTACVRAADAHAGRATAARAASLLVAARELEFWVEPALLVRLAPTGTHDAEFWRHAAGLSLVQGGDATALCDVAQDPAACELLRDLVRLDEAKVLHELAILTATLVALGADPAPPRAVFLSSGDAAAACNDRSELADVPPALRPDAAVILALGGERALDAALDRALGDVVARPARLTREVQSLEARVARDAHQDKRLAALKARLAQPPEPSARKLAACHARLARRVTEARAGLWRRTLQERLTALVPHAVSCHLETPRERAVVLALAALAPEARALAWRALAGDTFDAEPAHVAWSAALLARGLALDVWRDSALTREVVTPAGRRLTFRFERAAIEVFQMGAWFDTCLAPGAMNFFSVVANAVDHDKRLLVARDDAGTVQARCLFGLTGAGELLTFHVYSHEEQEFVRGVVRALACTLAEQVGARLAAHGRIKALVAPRWYDDGPVDLAQHLSPLEDGGALATALRGALPEAALDLVIAHLGAERVAAELARVVTHPTILEEPRRARAILAGFPSVRLPLAAALVVADAVAEAAPEFARGLLVTAFGARRRRGLGLLGEQRARLAELLLALGEPARALAVSRHGRGPLALGRRASFARADALLALGRRNEARSVLEPLAAAGDAGAAAWLARR